MRGMMRLAAADGVSIDAYRAEPAGAPRGGLVVLQEIFGVNAHVRRVTDGFAAEGYLAIAPALFDRAEPAVEMGYTPEEARRGQGLLAAIPREKTMLDVAAAAAAAGVGGRVGVVGYCWGGTLAYAAACDLDRVAAAVGYYGGGISRMLDRRPRAPVMLHFGERDAHIPLADVEAVRAALPDVPVFTYPAGHGFNCEARAAYDKPSAALALDRTLAFLVEHLG